MGSVVTTEKLQAEAAAWLIRCEAANGTAQDRASFEAWLAQSPRHRAAYMWLRAAWNQADRLRRLRPLDTTVNENLLSDVVLPSLKRSDRARAAAGAPNAVPRLLLAAGAALLLLAMAVAAHLFM